MSHLRARGWFLGFVALLDTGAIVHGIMRTPQLLSTPPVGADGAQSAVRAACGIGARITDYRQTAIVANFRCAQPNLATAWP